MMKRLLRTFFRGLTDIPLTLLFPVVMLLTIIGLPFPDQFPIVSTGDYQVASFPTGIAVYQQGINFVFYSFSPVNDYVTDSSGQKFTLTNYDDAVSAQNLAFNKPTFWQKPSVIWQQFTNQPIVRYVPLKTFIGVSYKAELGGQSILLNRQVRLPANHQFQSVTSTMKVSADDVIFDQSGTVFSATDVPILNTISPILKINLAPAAIASNAGQQVVPISEDTTYVFHPNLSGLMAVHTQPGQQVFFDRANLLLLITEPVSANTSLIETRLQLDSLKRYPEL